MQHLLSLTFLLLVFCLPTVQAQGTDNSSVGHRLGVSIDTDELNLLDRSSLNNLMANGITLLEIEGAAPERVLTILREAGIFLFVRQQRLFSTAHDLSQATPPLTDDHQLINFYETELPGQVAAYSLFQYPDENNITMRQAMSLHAASMASNRAEPVTLYYESAFGSSVPMADGYSFRSKRHVAEQSASPAADVTHFYLSENDRTSVENLRDLLSMTFEENESVVLIEFSPLLELLDRYPPLGTSLQEYALSGRIVFPLPGDQTTSSPPNYIVLMLIFILATYMMHYKFNLFYNQSLFRYFSTHHFFIEDIMEYRLRAPLTGLTQFFQFMLVTGLFTWILTDLFISPLGQEALAWHFPLLQLAGSGMSGYVILGMAVAGGLQLLSLLILHLPAFRTRSFGQTLNVFGWALHLNFLVLILIVAIYEANGPELWISRLAVLFFIFWFLNALFASIDIAKYLKKRRLLYLFGTIGIHLILIAVVMSAVTLLPDIWQPLQLALSLP